LATVAVTGCLITGALQDFQGAIVAITHNPSFAESLNATHVLRVAAGKAKMETNMGLTAADFDHSPVTRAAGGGTPSPSRAPTPSASGGKKRGGSKGKGSKSVSVSPTPSPSPSPPPVAAATAAAPKKKRTTLSWQEQQEYKVRLRRLLFTATPLL
jgi:hypothetical protein